MAASLLLLAPMMAGQKEERTWGELANLANRQIRLTTPKGVVIQGPMTALESEGLVMQIRSTTDKKAYPKGRYVAPRAEVKTVDVLTKGRKFRAIGTIVGVWSGLALGVYAGGHMDSAGAALTIFGLVGGGLTTAGYLIGDAADTHTLTITVRP
jgi:hypothetical protein